MDPFVRTLVLVAAMAFCVFFAVLTISVAAKNGVDLAVAISIVILALVFIGLLGAIRNPPPE
jgi:hypothetical protein